MIRHAIEPESIWFEPEHIAKFQNGRLLDATMCTLIMRNFSDPQYDHLWTKYKAVGKVHKNVKEIWVGTEAAKESVGRWHDLRNTWSLAPIGGWLEYKLVSQKD